MKKFFAYLVICFTVNQSTASASNESEKLLKAFDFICISSRLDFKNFKTVIKILKGKRAPDKFVRLVNPDYKIGYFINFEGKMIFSAFREKTPQKNSRACSITVKEVSFQEGKRLIERNFPVKKVETFQQGISKFATYRGHLVGYSNEVALSVQSGINMTSLSIFEIPKYIK